MTTLYLRLGTARLRSGDDVPRVGFRLHERHPYDGPGFAMTAHEAVRVMQATKAVCQFVITDRGVHFTDKQPLDVREGFAEIARWVGAAERTP